VITTVAAGHRAQRLARAEREFVAGVSHELSTPLSVICVAGENLADGLVGGEDAVRRYGVLVREEGRRLRALVEQVLEFQSPLETAMRREPVDLHAIVERAVEAVRPEADRLGLVVRSEVPARLPPVTGDAALLQAAFGNLLGNALKHGGDGGWVGVRAVSDGPQVSVSVEDRGRGIEPREQRRIFEPFYRGRDARRRQVRGSGLGLALVRRTVERHGGSIALTSRPGSGSVFTVRLPAALPPAGPVAEEVHAQAHPAG
jgi:signal transduction histidine kinase